MKKFLFIIIPVLAVFFCSLFLLTSLDRKVYDLFLRTLPSLKEDESVLIVKVDDLSIENVGIFPWTRDILADAIIFLREMGADTVVFDLSYLDKSPVKVDPKYVNQELPEYLNYGFNQIDDTISQVMDAFASRQIGPSDAEAYKSQMLYFNSTVRESLNTSISYVARDVDAYFAKTLRFFGKSYLTLTMVTPEDIIGEDKTFDMSPYDVKWLEENVALKNITALNDTLTPQLPGVIPAIPELLTNATGAGFVNAAPDQDGYRRRVHLLLKYNGKYYGQLGFVPLLDKLGNPEVEVTNNHIVLKNALINGTERDVRIPRTEDGSILVKWPKKEFRDYNQISSWDLIANNRQEAVFVKNLKAMEDAGFFSYWNEGETPLDKYNNAEYVKQMLFEGENNQAGITFESYAAYRKGFIDTSDQFLNGKYEDIILSDIDKDNTAVAEYVNGFFKAARQQYADLLAIREKAEKKTAGAFCIIGVDATSMTDDGLTTFQERFPNVGIHAAVTNMIISEEFLDDSPAYVSIIIALILSVSLGIFIHRFNTRNAMIAGFLTLAVSVFSLLILFVISRRYIGVVVPFTSISATFLTLSGINFFDTIREKSFLRSAFSRYLAPAVINEIIADPSKLNLGGEKREMTAIFTDIRGFSTISESLDPADLVKLLNLYLTDMSNTILANRGTIDKYEGDAIIAFFGAPIHMAEHAVLACRTAVQMKIAEKELNKRIIAENLCPSQIFTRIGINTGDMIVGNMGTPDKMDYTIMGNAVNLAARLEGVNKQYGTRGILISEHTRAQVGDEFLLRRLDRIRVVGVNTPLRIFELISFAKDTDVITDSSTALIIPQWEMAIDLYEGQVFTEARDIFKEIAVKDNEDMVAQLFADRCDAFLKNPPDKDWNGVFTMLDK